jgi:hypothetical protein
MVWPSIEKPPLRNRASTKTVCERRHMREALERQSGLARIAFASIRRLTPGLTTLPIHCGSCAAESRLPYSKAVGPHECLAVRGSDDFPASGGEPKRWQVCSNFCRAELRAISLPFCVICTYTPASAAVVAVPKALLDDIPACAITLLTGDFDVDYCRTQSPTDQRLCHQRE